MEFFKALWNDVSGLFDERIELGTNSVTTLNIIVWSLFIGFMIAIGVTLYNKFVVGRVVRALISREAHTKEAALSAQDVDCTSVFIRFALRKSSSLRRTVRMVGDGEDLRADTPFEEAKFYVPHEQIHRAKVIYGEVDASVPKILLSVFAFLLLAVVAFVVVPDLIQLLANFIGSITPNDKII